MAKAPKPATTGDKPDDGIENGSPGGDSSEPTDRTDEAAAALHAQVEQLTADLAAMTEKYERAAAHAQVEQRPDALLLDADFGFSVNSTLRVWHPGVLITKRADVAELLAHGAPARKFREIA